MYNDRTLSGMLRHGTIAKHCCMVCDRFRPINVADLAARLGERASLWDYFMPCEAEGCDGLTYVLATTSLTTPFRPLKSYNILADGQGGWAFLPIWKDTAPFMNGIEAEG